MTLKISTPTQHAPVAGSVGSWKKELIGFQVAGRVRFVHEPGVAVQGRLLGESGKVL